MACSGGEKLSRYLADELPRVERHRLEQHLAGCADCRRAVEEMRVLETLLEQVAPVEPPTDLTSRTLAQARQVLSSSRPRQVAPAAPQWVLGAMAVAAVLLLAVHAYTPAPETGRPSGPVVTEKSPARPMMAQMTPPPLAAPTRWSGAPAAAPPAPVSRPRSHASSPARQRAVPTPAVASVKPARKPLPPPPLVALTSAETALHRARHYGFAGDTELQVAALENLALVYPDSTEASRALLVAADVHRSRGELREADAAYRQTANMRRSPALNRALAYKALGDLRRETAGADDVARRHYRQATQALQEEARRLAKTDRARALMVLGEVQETMGDGAKAAAAYAEAATLTGADPVSEESAARLAQVL